MNIELVTHLDCCEVKVIENGEIIIINDFNTLQEAKAFIKGITATRYIASRLIQSIPMDYVTSKDSQKKYRP